MTCGIHAPDCIVRQEPAWSAPDNSRRTTEQYAFHLPAHVAAKIAALEDIYPTRSLTPLVGDLLAATIADVEQKLPTDPGASWVESPVQMKNYFWRPARGSSIGNWLTNTTKRSGVTLVMRHLQNSFRVL